MQRNLIPIQLRDDRSDAANQLYLYYIDLETCLDNATKQKLYDNDRLLKIHDYSRSSAQRNQIQANNAAIDLELKKIGIALQQISKRLSNRPLVSGSVRIRTIDMNATNNAYTMIFEYHGLAAEVHTDVPVPKDIDFNKITVQQQAPQPAPALDMSIIVTDLQKGPTKSVFIQANKRNNPVRIILPPATKLGPDRESKYADDNAPLSVQQRQEALQLFIKQDEIIKVLDKQAEYLALSRRTIEENQARARAIQANIQAHANAPDEAKAAWQTATAALAEFNQQSDQQTQTLNNAELQLNPRAEFAAPNLKQTAEQSLVYNYGIYKGHQKHLLKPTETSTVRALQYTALEYFNSIAVGFQTQVAVKRTATTPEKRAFTDKTLRKLQEFNEKFKYIAEIKALSAVAGQPEPLLALDETLPSKDLTRLAQITNDLITVSVQKQGHGWSRSLAFLKANLETADELKDKFKLTPTSFEWLGTISDVNKKAPYYDTRLLEAQITTFQQETRQQRGDIDNTSQRIRVLEQTLQQAAAETAARAAELDQLKQSVAAKTSEARRLLARAEINFNTVNDVKDNIMAMINAQDPVGALSVREKYEELTANITALRQAALQIENRKARADATNSIAEATRIEAEITPFATEFDARYKSVTGGSKALGKAIVHIQGVDAAAKQAQAVAEEEQRRAQVARAQEQADEQLRIRQAEAARARIEANLQHEQHAALEAEQKLETNKQKVAAREALVVETAKKIIHILSDVSYWHKQVRLWGGVEVSNPAGGKTTVPHGISEMIKHSRPLNTAALTYAEAAAFMAALKKIGEEADQRGNWNCCYPVRKTGTTGALYNYAADFDVLMPPQALHSDNDFNNIHPEWSATYGVVSNATPLLADHQHSPSASPNSQARLISSPSR
jgi:hypothetical protein